MLDCVLELLNNTGGAARVCSPKSRIAPSVAASFVLVQREVRAWQASNPGADEGF
jgi:hypothetical protein